MHSHFQIYTIGHSNHSIDYFLELLEAHQIQCVVDVRSIPKSGYNPHFNKDNLRATLQTNHKMYLSFAKEFGAHRHEEEVLNENRKVIYAKVHQSPDFLAGVERLRKGLQKGYKIALMCAEAEPLPCHRFSMISSFLHQNQFEVWHILKDKMLLSHQEAEQKLVEKYAKKLPKPDLFQTEISTEAKIKLAYQIHTQERTRKK